MRLLVKLTVCIIFAVALSTVFLVLVQSQYMIDKAKILEDKTLKGFVFRTLILTTVDECFLNCIEDCICTAFQVCGAECQLLSSNRFQSPLAFGTMRGCSYYDVLPDLPRFREMQQSNCSPVHACSFLGGRCKNGGTYVLLTPTDHTTPRYKCTCLPGYTGHLCQYIIKSCRGHIDGSRAAGKYTVLDDNNKPFDVFCDFGNVTAITAWTLVQSYALRHKQTFDVPYFNDSPVNEDIPGWDKYRLSKFRMQGIQTVSTKFRVTCNYDIDGVSYDDFLEARKEQIDIMTFKFAPKTVPHICFTVDYVSVRGNDCAFCNMTLYQTDSLVLHTDSSPDSSSFGCDFKPPSGETCDGIGEDNFGHYKCITPTHKCSSTSNATTQTWIGKDLV